MTSHEGDDRGFYDSLRRDCRHFRSDRPCLPHKRRGVVCASCDEYDPAGERIAIVKLAAVGDVLRTTSFVPGLRRRHPHAQISWLTHPAARPLFSGNLAVDAIFASDGASVPADLATLPQDLVICPDADRLTVALARGVPLRAGGRRVGFDLDADGRVVPLSPAARRWFLLGISDARKRANRETYQSLVGAIFELPLPVADRPILVLSEDERGRARAWLEAAGGPAGNGLLVGLNTGAGGRWPQKQWTLEGQAGLIRALACEGHRVLLLGGPEEVERHRELRARVADGCIDAGNDNSLRDFFARLDLCDVLVSGDTMALHVGCALGKPVVALFGPTSAPEIELYGHGAKVLTDQLDCLGCYASCDKSPDCQDLIRVDMVMGALAPLLAEVRARRSAGGLA